MSESYLFSLHILWKNKQLLVPHRSPSECVSSPLIGPLCCVSNSAAIFFCSPSAGQDYRVTWKNREKRSGSLEIVPKKVCMRPEAVKVTEGFKWCGAVRCLETTGSDSCWWSTDDVAGAVSVSSGKRLNKTQLESWHTAHDASLSAPGPLPCHFVCLSRRLL